jgi:hypothetical protein
MMFTVINVLHRKPTDNDYWQLHQHTCPEILRFQADGYDIHALEADTIAAAQAAWIDCDLEYMGYGPQDLRVMPCCQESGAGSSLTCSESSSRGSGAQSAVLPAQVQSESSPR